MKPLLVALVVLGLGLLALQPGLRLARGWQHKLRIRAANESVEARYAERARLLGQPNDDPTPVRGPLDEASALFFYPSNGKADYRYDPLAYSVPVPTEPPLFLEFPEHPRGGFPLKVDSEGLREDMEVEVPKRDLRVVVAGDSHTYGLCANDESFSNLLEPLLSDALGGRDVDVLNAGVGATFFQNYAGTFERLAHHDPDLLVLVAYGGNDFSATMGLDRYLRGGAAPAMRPHFKRARELPRGAAEQETNQLVYFLNNPDDVAEAPATAAGLTLEAAGVAERLGAGFVAVYLPPPSRGQPELYARVTAETVHVLEVEPEALALSDRLADEWLEQVRAAGVRAVDLRPVFRAVDVPLYWTKDLHLNLEGHRRVAAALAPTLEELLEGR